MVAQWRLVRGFKHATALQNTGVFRITY